VDQIASAAEAAFRTGDRPLFLGGDHFITYPLVRGMARVLAHVTLIQFDAHPDLYDEYESDRLSHACPFARIMEEGLVDKLIQVGIRGANGHLRDQARRFGVEVLEMRALPAKWPAGLAGPIYVSFDLDVLDPAFVPGVSHPEPGGLSTREALRFLDCLPGPVIGADLVELNPLRDVGGLTAVTAAKLVKELAGAMLKPA
jgi:agmatinase